MKSKPISFVGAILIVLFCNSAQAQFGSSASAVWITDCNQSNFFNTTGTIGPAGNVFHNANFGVHTQNSGSLILRGAQVNTFKNPASSNVCVVRMSYRVYPQATVPGAFIPVVLANLEDCNAGTFPSGGACAAGDQKWQTFAPVNLTNFVPGNYVLEVIYDVSGSQTTTTGCSDIVNLNNGGANYTAFFSLQSPNLSSTNPSSCFGNEGSITIGGLAPGSSYQLSYTDDAANVGPAAFVANGAGQVIVTGLDKGFYSNFVLLINGCTTNLFTGIILSDPIFVPTFPATPPFCAGTTPPTLPTSSNNGITGTWSPAVVNDQATGTYTFTPASGQCGLIITRTITVIPRTTPTFPFGTSLVICGSGTVPNPLPGTSSNGIPGTWSPSTVDDQNSGTYTFTPNPGECANPTTFTVTVNPNITPTFAIGSSASICAGENPPVLPTSSSNGITGTWSPATVDNQNSGSYTFTPGAGQCAVPVTFNVTVSPIVAPTFAFGTSLSLCSGETPPSLPTTSSNGIAGTWSPTTINNQTSGTYTFTPAPGQCTTPFTLSTTVNPNIVPTFALGSSTSFCAGATAPGLPPASTNGINGSWSPSSVDNQNSGTYTFTPTAGQCALPFTFAVTVNPNVTPVFTFGPSATICAGATAPTLPTSSSNGITGTWSPATVNNQNSDTYTFTPTAGQCVTPATTTFTVTVTPNAVPVFSFGNSLTICSGVTPPSLPTTSTNGIAGSWNPSVVNNQASGTYVFTAPAGQCVVPFTFTVTVNPIVTPAFSFGTAQSVCIGLTPPTLPTLSSNGVMGSWSPGIVDNQVNGTYTFTPDPGQCVTGNVVFTYEVNPVPSTTGRSDTTVFDGAVLPVYSFTSTPSGVITWTNSNPSIGLAASGTGNVPSFTAVNMTNAAVTATITITPRINGCAGTARTYIITVLPLNKDVFVPNVFSPNRDGKNDILFVYGNYIDKVDMRIFNQWGQQIAMISNKTQGWDGTHKGNPQPVGVYVYVLRAVLVNGNTVDLKGSVTLVR